MGRAHTGPGLVEAVDLQSIGAELKIYGEIDDPNMRHFNPSIAWLGNELKIAVRSCNFSIDSNGKWYLRDGSAYSKTDVLYGDLHPITLQVSNLNNLELSDNSPIVTKLAGLEDVRLFQGVSEMFGVGFESDRMTRSLHNKSAKMAEYKISKGKLEYLQTLEKPDDSIVEKNWSPTDKPGFFEYTYSPTQVVRMGKVIGEPYKGDIHGGTQLIKQKDGTYLSIVHRKVLNRLRSRPGVYDKYVYYHYLARHSKEGFITHLSKPFTFGTKENIEFAAGMVEYKDDLLISFGIRDCKYAIAKVSKQKLVDLLEEYEGL